MNILDIIEKKKKGKELSKSEIEFFIDGVTRETLPDYQISSLLMAILLKGMTDEETYHLAISMLKSGEIPQKNFEGFCVDKHSTGGVSDSTSLIIVPFVSLFNIKFAKFSGRALSHTGGTLDKLESFKNLKVDLTAEEFLKIVEKSGACIASQTKELVPADKKLYALRDVTGTVDSIPLISASIMSKKLASPCDAMALDVKCGDGAFMKTYKNAVRLAKSMVKIGEMAGRKTVAYVTSMAQPLGDDIGCNLEIMGVIRVLKGEKNDLYKVAKEISAKLLSLSGVCDEEEGKRLFDAKIASGEVLNKFKEIIVAQGGTGEEFETGFKTAKYKILVLAEKAGYITKIRAQKLGLVNLTLGGGRLKKEDKINHGVGITINKRLGATVDKGDILAIIYSEFESEELTKSVKDCFIINKNKPKRLPKLIYGKVENGKLVEF